MSYSSTVLADSPLGYWRLGDPAVSAATSSTNFGSEPPGNAFDGSATTYWTTNAVSTGWLRAQLTVAVVVTQYSITRRDSISNRNPKDWTFEGSNDGTSWTTLDTQTGITWPTAGEVKSFSFTNTTAYLYYRLNITANNGDTYLSVAELRMSGVDSLADSSGNGHTGTSTKLGLVTGALTGDSDSGSSFNGTSSRGDVAYASWMAAPTAFTIEAWIKTIATGIHSIADRDANSSRVYQFRQNSGSLEFVKISTGVVTASQAATINDGAWHHVVATYDGSVISLYKDGSLLGSPTSAAGSLTGTDPISIGMNQGSSGAWFNGSIDEVAYYGSVLSSTRIAAHYTAGTTTPGSEGSASITLSASGGAGATGGGSASLSLSGTAAAAGDVAGAASLTFSATGGTDAPADATGAASLTLSASGEASAALAASATLDLAASGTALAVLAAVGSATLDLSASGTAVMSSGGTATLTLSAGGVAVAVFTTDLSNALDGLDLLLTAIVTMAVPVVTPPPTSAVKYDKAIAYPVPVMVDGRPT